MSIEQLSVSMLLSLSALLGVSATPEVHPEWKVTKAWEASGEYQVFEASSEVLPEKCRRNPDSFIQFPMVVHGAHQVFADGVLVAKTGDPSFKTVESFYGAPTLRCAQLIQSKIITWNVVSYSKYFARIAYLPRIKDLRPLHNVLGESVHVMGAGGAFTMSLFALTIFSGRVALSLLISIALSCLGGAFYFGGTVAGLLGLSTPMLFTHKVADLSLWFGVAALMNALRLEGALGRRTYFVYLANVAVGASIILAGTSGDMIQFGTSLPFAATMVILFIPLVAVFRRMRRTGFDRRSILQILSLMSFISACFNDMFAVLGLVNSAPIYPVGFMTGTLFFAFAVNERINETYRERDFLRSNLEAEVKRKTAELTKKTEELESTMASLKSTQAELVQSAKLASLGTLSAGIAHEINNSLNYVNGALQPLERLILKSCAAEDRGKIDKLVGVMKEGLSLTLEIIKSLRSYTGLNQAKFNDVDLGKAVQTSLAILRSKTRGKIEVECAIPENLTVFGSVVGINQVFMNLISNAVDAMPEGGRLILEGEKLSGAQVEIRVRDTGCGMSPETTSRIFDPFFTTKEVGKGTGIGLHIVRNEVERHQGEIHVESVLGQGTCFRVRFPQDGSERRFAA